MSKAQSISEYVILISIVTLALIGMQVYMKRGVQGVIKDTADLMGNQRNAEEIDVLKGVKQDSNTAVETSAITPDGESPSRPATRRTTISEVAGQQVDFQTQLTTIGNQTYEAERKQQ